jgi:hypothetical protein
MKSMFSTSAPTGFPGAGSADLRPSGTGRFGAALTGTSLPGCGGVRLRAPETFTAPYEGTGVPFGRPVTGGSAFGRTPVVVDVVTREVAAPTPAQQQNALTRTDAITQHDGTTLGIHSSRRPPS